MELFTTSLDKLNKTHEFNSKVLASLMAKVLRFTLSNFFKRLLSFYRHKIAFTLLSRHPRNLKLSYCRPLYYVNVLFIYSKYTNDRYL